MKYTTSVVQTPLLKWVVSVVGSPFYKVCPEIKDMSHA
jgi:hypothetical protein